MTTGPKAVGIIAVVAAVLAPLERLELASVMKLKVPTYPVLACLIAAGYIFFSAFYDLKIVFPHLHTIFFYENLAFGFVFLAQAWLFHRRGLNDFTAGLFFVWAILFCLVSLWFAPLYEVAYILFAIASSFLRLNRWWLFPLTYFVGLCGVIGTYFVQDDLGWQVPALGRYDWVSVMILGFLAAWVIQEYAIGAFRREEDRLQRFSIIGRESTRLVHDLKGLLSSPIMLVDALRNRGTPVSTEELEKQLTLLAEDMDNVRDMIKAINRLVVLDDRLEVLSIRSCLESAVHVLQRRLHGVKLELPEEDRKVIGNADRLHSVFFNLLLNAIEAAERERTKDLQITIRWDSDALIFADNVRSQNGPQPRGLSSKGQGSGLGLRLAEEDMQRMGGQFRSRSDGEQIQFILIFTPA